MDVFMDLYGHYFLEKDIRSVRLMLNAAHNDLYSMLFSINLSIIGCLRWLTCKPPERTQYESEKSGGS